MKLTIQIVATLLFTGSLLAPARMIGSDDTHEEVTILPESKIDGDLFTAGRDVKVMTEIAGDAAVAGENVLLQEPVQGYVLAAGSNVQIDGTVANDLWAAGANVSVNAAVDDNVWLAGRSVVLQPSASVAHHAHIAGEQVRVLGPVERDLKVAAANFELASEVGGSVRAEAGRVTLLPDAIIRGDLTVTSPQAPEIAPEAQVLGRVVHHATETEDRSTWADWLINWLAIFSALMVLGAATVAFTSLWPNRITEKTRSRPLRALLQGIIGFVVIPLICVLLTMTVIGIPLAMVLLAFYFVGLLLSGVVVALPIGDWLLARFRRAEASWYVRLAAGALLLGFFASLPWIGWAIGLLVMIIGFGALLLERIDAWRRPYATAT